MLSTGINKDTETLHRAVSDTVLTLNMILFFQSPSGHSLSAASTRELMQISNKNIL